MMQPLPFLDLMVVILEEQLHILLQGLTKTTKEVLEGYLIQLLVTQFQQLSMELWAPRQLQTHSLMRFQLLYSYQTIIESINWLDIFLAADNLSPH